ncbi:hypothetical protein PG996_000215 [Apiospora saccharicola]|uniref:Ecp2 effector protein domain-containing protein n=1 Tax=Apiospora saccharicola TaxID=335842 RepID=A0ABR1WD49_9PEZI
MNNNTTIPTPTLQLPHDPLRVPDPRGPLCNIPGYAPGLEAGVHIDILRLQKLGAAQCTASPGPRKCTRTACFLGAAVWLCNDHDYVTSAPCSVIGDYAQRILDKCKYSVGDRNLVQGQLFDTGNKGDVNQGWGNVVVGHDDC